MKVGTIHIGYSDDYPRKLTNRGRVKVRGKFKPVLGTVSANHHLIDLKDINASEGHVVEAIGRTGENTVNQLAKKAEIMTYSLTIGLNPFTPRIYFEKDCPVAISELTIIY